MGSCCSQEPVDFISTFGFLNHSQNFQEWPVARCRVQSLLAVLHLFIKDKKLLSWYFSQLGHYDRRHIKQKKQPKRLEITDNTTAPEVSTKK